MMCSVSELENNLYENDQKSLYISKSIVWQVQRSHGVLYIPFDGKEIPYREYEVLVQC